ncbi:polyadenylate-binding protein 2-like [Trifolium pratense]|uniref:Polyadenylate-binding protein 2-like n=1 Tax=Trifolium pratense TaxID=57577 RepID=A0A2K3MWR9_TRIPR|nr:polyadenylate-binding protein 2-like [Trifolium pratense]
MDAPYPKIACLLVDCWLPLSTTWTETGNISLRVDYACTAEIVRRHFQSCGIVNRVTILMNEFSLPKGCAYVEFLKIDAVPKALLLNESELHGRKIKVCAKRTNIPGMNQYSGRYTWVLRSRRPPPLYPRPGYGSVPRFRRSMRYRPY